MTHLSNLLNEAIDEEMRQRTDAADDTSTYQTIVGEIARAAALPPDRVQQVLRADPDYPPPAHLLEVFMQRYPRQLLPVMVEQAQEADAAQHFHYPAQQPPPGVSLEDHFDEELKRRGVPQADDPE